MTSADTVPAIATTLHIARHDRRVMSDYPLHEPHDNARNDHSRHRAGAIDSVRRLLDRPQQRPDEQQHGDLPNLDAGVEREEAGCERAPRQVHLAQYASESKAMDEPKDKGQAPPAAHVG